MALSAGSRLGPYEVLSPLGAGGMGEVYRALDPRLGREVAIKVLPAAMAADPERLRRFEQETRAVGALNHPHILTVYDVGRQDGTPYVVTELLEGETLREVLLRRTPTARQVVAWGVQAAQGLSAAHRKGIVHRDVKPENLFLTGDGRIKILDFGLAKLTQVDEQDLQTKDSTAAAGTQPGVVLGTVAYMSPEQVKAEAVDYRSDIFSLGVVLYELLCGKNPFRRGSVTATLTAILHETPVELSTRQAGIPLAVERIVERSLEKSKEQRFQSAHDVALALETALEGGSATAALREIGERSPYPGLSAFTEADAGQFFGREQEVKELWEKLKEGRLLAVIGPSGAGKTSFVRAGVAAGRPEGWAAIVATPGNAPLRGLGRALGPQLANDPEALRELASFEDGETAFELLSRWRRNHDEALVVIDQFEELFTLNPAETQARFASLLGRLASEADIHVLLSLRDDFLMRCLEPEPLAPVVNSLTPLRPLTREGLRRALVEPALKHGYRFEDDALVDRMVEFVEGARSALPLLAFAVSRLWEKRDREKKLLTRQAYEEIGGVAGALAQHAEATMERIGAERQNLVRELFRNLVTGQGTRAVIDREELLSAFPDRAAAEHVLGQLVDARLLTSYEVESDPGEQPRNRIEVVHESLLKAWPRLVRWQAQDEEGALLRDQLRQAAHLWGDKGKPEDLLWTGTSFHEYQLWRERYPGGLSEVEESFGSAMTGRARRQRNRRRTAYAVLLAAVVMVAAGLGTLWRKSARETRRAEAETARAEAGRLLSLGRLKLADSPMGALAYAIASLERSDNEPARRFAVEALAQGPPALFLSDQVLSISPAWSADGEWLAVGGQAGLVLVNRETGKQLQLTKTFTAVVGFTADGRRLVTYRPAPLRVLEVWAMPGGRLERTLELARPSAVFPLSDDHLLAFDFDVTVPNEERRYSVRRLSLDGAPDQVLGRWAARGPRYWGIDPDARWIVYWQKNRIFQQRLDDLSAPARLIGTHEGKEVRVSTRPWSNWAVTSDERGEIRIWDVASARLGRALKSPASAQNLALDPKRRFLATSPDMSMPPRSLVLFELAAPRSTEPMPLLGSERNQIDDMTFSPDGAWLATAHDGTTILWNMAGARSILLGRHEPPDVAVVFTPDGHLLSSSEGGVLRSWPLAPASGEGVRVLWSQPGAWIGSVGGQNLVVDRQGRFAVVTDAPRARIIIVPLDGSPASTYQLKGPPGVTGSWSMSITLDPGGRLVAARFTGFTNPEASSMRVLDLSTGADRIFDTHPPKGETGWGRRGTAWEAVGVPAWLPDGRLVTDGDAGLRVWDLATGSSRLLRPAGKPATGVPWLLASPDSKSIFRLDVMEYTGANSSLSAFDLGSGTTRGITSHGNRLSSFALDAGGTILVSGDVDGVVRVGPPTGAEPHLLFGHTGKVTSVAVSPDGKWVASGSDDGTIRLWPMPDLTKPPLHTLRLDQLLAKLRSLTNLRAVRDKGSDTGWKIEIGPFPGWKNLPSWQP